MRQVGGKVVVDDGVLPKWVVMLPACVCEVKIYMGLRLSGSLQEERMSQVPTPISLSGMCSKNKERLKGLLLYSSKKLAE